MIGFASDFDGTLYFMKEKETMKPSDVAAIRDFQKKGNLFGVCTGRSLRGITDIVKDLTFDFYILVSGALIVDKKRNVLSKTCISYEVMKEIYKKYEKEVMIIIQANDNVYCMQQKFPLQVFIQSLEEMQGADIYGLSFGTKNPEEAKRIAQEVNELYGNEVIAYANVKNVDIVGKECSKGKAICFVKEYFGLDWIGGIGDSYNDIPMLIESDQAYTFSYAPEKVQFMSNQVVDNVAQALEHFTLSVPRGMESNSKEGDREARRETVAIPRETVAMTDEELWNAISQLEKEEKTGSRWILLSAIFMGMGMIFGVFFANFLFAAPFFLLGIGMIVLGEKKASHSNQKKVLLLARQMGPFAKEVYEDIIGKFEFLNDERLFYQVVEESDLMAAWNKMEASNVIRGEYKDNHYMVANVSLIYKQRGMNHGEDLDQDTYRFPVLSGIWLHMDKKFDLKNPIYIREACLTEKPRFKNVLPEKSHGRDNLSGYTILGDSFFDQQFHVYAENSAEAIKFLNPQMRRLIQDLRKDAEGPLSIEFHPDGINVAVETPFRIFSYLIDDQANQKLGIKNGFLVNLQYEYRLLRDIYLFPKGWN